MGQLVAPVPQDPCPLQSFGPAGLGLCSFELTGTCGREPGQGARSGGSESSSSPLTGQAPSLLLKVPRREANEKVCFSGFCFLFLASSVFRKRGTGMEEGREETVEERRGAGVRCRQKDRA